MLPIMLALLACDLKDANTEELGMPYQLCEEVGRETLTDPSVASDGMDFAASDALAVVSGDFEGSFDLDNTGTNQADASLSVASAGDVVFVEMDFAEVDTADTGLLSGAPDAAECPSYYEVPATVSFVVDDGSGTLLLDESLSVTLRISEADAASFGAEISFDDLVGSFAPADFDPSEWDTTTLRLGAGGSSTGWTGSWSWSASREVSGDMAEGMTAPELPFALVPVTE